MQRFLHYINKYVTNPMEEEEFEIFLGHFVYKKIRKKQFLLQEGEVCKYMAFIITGAMRKYYVNDKGGEHIVDLYIEEWWAGDRESFTINTPSIYNIDAWEDCELLLLTRENTIKLRNECPTFNEFVIKLDELNNIATQRRITSTISFTAEKRYEDFVERHPYFMQRFPQHIVASYLGITKDTLSRVRKKAVRK